MTTESLCPCGSQKPYTHCCQPLLAGQAHAPTPEALMRSRYTAFCRDNVDYLIATHHPSQRRPGLATQLQETIDTTVWLGLKVIDAPAPAAGNPHGFVEFAAFYKNPEPAQLHERSKFIRENGRWYYQTGALLPPVTLPRNEPCWCGSGKKYKLCHGRQT
jgi:SEC-C motif-containing protein